MHARCVGEITGRKRNETKIQLEMGLIALWFNRVITTIVASHYEIALGSRSYSKSRTETQLSYVLDVRANTMLLDLSGKVEHPSYIYYIDKLSSEPMLWLHLKLCLHIIGRCDRNVSLSFALDRTLLPVLVEMERGNGTIRSECYSDIVLTFFEMKNIREGEGKGEREKRKEREEKRERERAWFLSLTISTSSATTRDCYRLPRDPCIVVSMYSKIDDETRRRVGKYVFFQRWKLQSYSRNADTWNIIFRDDVV